MTYYRNTIVVNIEDVNGLIMDSQEQIHVLDYRQIENDSLANILYLSIVGDLNTIVFNALAD
jgi:hypothetical protein